MGGGGGDASGSNLAHSALWQECLWDDVRGCIMQAPNRLQRSPTLCRAKKCGKGVKSKEAKVEGLYGL